ncbi:potassium-transporting ATPase subunit KdpC [Undibacterium oligocarboniphilum]|uniref:Potassium-transporting ATPase KdpC subunit n=1 Tax=Undibacterium oligocarboniphilum TaxID=666702 RepID=A0A850QDG6_9BURK|nr:potassium-transporting ATPase subunit KdpC [Undibacterium oligocarboniphilum]MBC3870706.1 potassium-transporting ATPase subunit KdpC [Undibacterium oligocarboniphilum]NVO78492.1 potassium-transporting ATPase subunit KdpC [Undibacterium oligocarboniphilum]
MKTLRPLIASFVLLSALTGVIYPLAVTGIGKVAFPNQAGGSLIEKNGKLLGSDLIGQNFSAPKYFWSRPSAAGTFAYNGLASGGSNSGPTNPALKAAVEDRIKALKEADPANTKAIPVDLVTASGSGLDPHISPAAADYQLERVARVRGIAPERVRALVSQYTEDPQFGILGESRVNVLRLNLALDELK